eukprot:scaffold59207_cov66-Phaeocystis_antarctica.AAC.1
MTTVVFSIQHAGAPKLEEIVVEVHPEWAPIGAQRFFELIDAKYYDECYVYRVIPGFICQWGVPASPADWQKWGANKIKDDPVKVSNEPGTLSFATSGPDARGSQLFINYGKNDSLDDQGFSPFAMVTSGMDVALRFGEAQGKVDQNEAKEKGNAYFSQFSELSVIKSVKRRA